ncbi:MAG: glycosyltransferase [Salinivirgaceae bacterium]|nr:glycosyltransferase [Salinivirgaceae bacterium]
MYTVICISVAVVLCYTALIICLFGGFRKMAKRQPSNAEVIPVSVILPFRNEEHCIETAISSLLAQKYDSDFEIIAVDDHSTDNSWQLLSNVAAAEPRLRLLKANGSGKKNALAEGLAASRFGCVAVADADCRYPERWLQSMSSEFVKNGCLLLCAPVKIGGMSNWFGNFQFVDFASLVGSGIGAAGCGRPIMCNGANMMFDKEAVMCMDDPFNAAVESGDDVFLLHAVKRLDKQKISFTCRPETIVETKAAPTFAGFMRQRMRWGGKTTSYTDADSIIVAGIVAATAVCVVASLLLIPWSWIPVTVVLVSKTTVDTLMLCSVCKVFGNRRLLWQMPVYEIVVALYTVAVVVGTIFGANKKWK